MQPPPPTSPISIRTAEERDVVAMTGLLAELGYEITLEKVASNLAQFQATGCDAVFVAEADEGLVGLLALHWTQMLHFDSPMARITTLVIKQGERGRGVGRLLVDRAKEAAREAGCETLELTTRTRRTDAQAFYQRLGFEADSVRLSTRLE